MAIKRILNYSVTWNQARESGGLTLGLQGGASGVVTLNSLEKVAALISLLRNETGLTYDTTTGIIVSAARTIAT
jgi:hypothetical protein